MSSTFSRETTELLKNLDKPSGRKEIMSFPEYLKKVSKEPWITRNSVQILHDMVMESGVEHHMRAGRPLLHTYRFFEASDIIGSSIVFGQQKAKQNLLEKIDNASHGGEAAKRLWILLGPPGSAKSRSMEGIKHGLHLYTGSERGKLYYLLLPSVDPRLKAFAAFQEGEIFYIPAPCYEPPLQIIPESIRAQFCETLKQDMQQESLDGFLSEHPYYDGEFKIDVSGRLSPASDKIFQDFISQRMLSWEDALNFVKVSRFVMDASRKVGIGSYTPRDEKSQEAGSLVGNIDYSLLPIFGSESHPLVHDYQGELCIGANGIVEIHEILKLSDKFLYELLFATQDRFFKPEGQPPIPFNGVIIGHTNFHEFELFASNRSFEALRSRTTFIEMPLSVDFKDEEKIYTFTYSNSVRKWKREKHHTAHCGPHSLEYLSLVAVMSRLYVSKKYPGLSLLQKALIYAGRADSGADNNMARAVIDEYQYTRPSEGTFGLDPRFIQNVFENTDHFQRLEFLANISRLKDESGGAGLLSSIALQNPCVTPLDLHTRLDSAIREQFAQDKSKLSDFQQNILPHARKWIFSQIAGDVYSAILRDDSIVESTWKKYTSHAWAYAHNATLTDELTRNDVRPNEEFMQKIESYLGIPDREIFRKELSDAISSVNHATLLENEPSYQAAVKRYVFENEFRSGENVKLLGWIKSGSSAASVSSKEQEQLNETVRYLMDQKEYCGKCAFHALIVTANASSIQDV